MVIRGPSDHPGAVAVEDESGRVVQLKMLSKQQREALAKQLLSGYSSGALRVPGAWPLAFWQGALASPFCTYLHLPGARPSFCSAHFPAVYLLTYTQPRLKPTAQSPLSPPLCRCALRSQQGEKGQRRGGCSDRRRQRRRAGAAAPRQGGVPPPAGW